VHGGDLRSDGALAFTAPQKNAVALESIIAKGLFSNACHTPPENEPARPNPCERQEPSSPVLRTSPAVSHDLVVTTADEPWVRFSAESIKGD
jgi:hypothetical protein